MFILNEEIKEQERQAIRELYPKFPDTQVIVTKVPLKPFYKAHRIQFVAMAHVTKILAKYGYLEVSGDKIALRYRRTKDSISLPDLVKIVDELHMTKFPSMSILSRVPKNEKKTKIEPVETPIQVEEPEDKKIVDNNLPVIGNHYYFQTDNLLIGYGILKTIEGVFDNNLKVESYRYEIENLSIKGQVALLRALQELTFIKVGDNRIQKVDFNLVCTTNVELWDLISKGGFRSDLYYRISHVRFNVPPVRDYYNIPGLMEFLIDQVCEEYNLTPYIDKHDLVIETMQKLHPYKGNIREIKSYLTTELIKLDASRSSTLTGIELMKTTPL
jgi:hypothetical protein